MLKAQLAQRTQAKPTEVTAGGFGLSFICGRVCRCPLVLGQQYRIWADAVFGEKKKTFVDGDYCGSALQQCACCARPLAVHWALQCSWMHALSLQRGCVCSDS